MLSGFIFTSNKLHSSHNTLSELLSPALLTDHWYFPSSLTPSSTLSLTPNVANPLPHASPSSSHSLTSTKDPPTVSFLFQLSSFLSPTTSPHLRSTLYLSPTTSPHLTSDPHTFDPPSTKANQHPLKPIQPKSTLKPINNPSSDPPFQIRSIYKYIYIYIFVYLFIYIIIYFI